ncbi:MAG: family 20 glycosylhydrolase [Bacteroidales bacterium]|nr:family 20 glycosylhydrolase [Bacteroidales bacterium]
MGSFVSLKKRTALLVMLCLPGILLYSCGGRRWPAHNEIAITWEVISNLHHPEEARVSARFTIKNNSKKTLDDSNWQLFYNQTPRFLLSSDPTAGVSVKHISGDWYTLYPETGFSLEPGETVTFEYESRFWWIKNSDAPKGFYVVFNDEKGKEKIVELTNIRIMPFERPEQLTRHLRDRAEVPSAERQYLKNERLQKVEKNELLPFIPSPVSYVAPGDSITINHKVRIVHDAPLQREALHLKNMLHDIMGWQVEVSTDFTATGPGIFLRLTDRLAPEIDLPFGKYALEAYALSVDRSGGIAISAMTEAGIFYGIQSLLALFPVDAFFEKPAEVVLPVAEVVDYPRFSYRGMHIDVARNFFPKEIIFKLLDILAFYKVNTLHMHLTDDEGWRLEIATLPELTAVGAQRGHTTRDAPALHPAFGSGPFAYAPGRQGSGYYTRQDFIDIVHYARDRHIRVIPEINLPGHARAAIKAMEARYEYYMQQGDEASASEYRLVDPDETSTYLSAQLFTDNVVNVARESVYRFTATVLDELVDIYAEAGVAFDVVHIGGDEVPSGAWSASPMVEQKLKTLPHIDASHNMHIYFIERVLEMASERGLKVAGWEEAALCTDDEGRRNMPYTPHAGGALIPYVWNNLWGAQDLAYRLANSGFPVVLCHVTAFYFDLAYSKDPEEPGLYWGGFVNTKSAWHYSPYDVFSTTLRDNMGRPVDVAAEYRHMERLRPEARHRILGVQAQLWSETLVQPELVEYYLLPKLLGFAETAWARERAWETITNDSLRMMEVDKGWSVFATTLGKRELHRLSALYGGFNYRIPPPGAVIHNGVLKANVEFPGLQIRYTLDGTEPQAGSELYEKPVAVHNAPVKVRVFDASTRGGRSVLLINESEEHSKHYEN